MRVRFLKDFDFRPRHGCIIAYPAGLEETVTTVCGDQAISRGCAIEIKKPTRDEAKNGKNINIGAGKAAKAAGRNTKGS